MYNASKHMPCYPSCNVERDMLASELAKLPLHCRSFKEKQRRRLAEDRKRDLDAMANQIKFALRTTAA